MHMLQDIIGLHLFCSGIGFASLLEFLMSSANFHASAWISIACLQRCGSYFTAVMYAEHWCEEHFNCLALGSPDFSHLELVRSCLLLHDEFICSCLIIKNDEEMDCVYHHFSSFCALFLFKFMAW